MKQWFWGLRHPFRMFPILSLTAMFMAFAFALSILSSGCDDAKKEKDIFSAWTLQNSSDTRREHEPVKTLDLTKATIGRNAVYLVSDSLTLAPGAASPNPSMQERLDPPTYPETNTMESTPTGATGNPRIDQATISEIQEKLKYVTAILQTSGGNNSYELKITDGNDESRPLEQYVLELSTDRTVLTVCSRLLFAIKSCSTYR